jgi:hypothetical protein
MATLQLLDIASARSGDKNNVCNVGVLAPSRIVYDFLVAELTAERVKAHFGELVLGRVDRYEWPSIDALNFVCHEALDGGGSRSLRMDTLGKNFSSHLLRLRFEVPEAVRATLLASLPVRA